MKYVGIDYHKKTSHVAVRAFRLIFDSWFLGIFAL